MWYRSNSNPLAINQWQFHVPKEIKVEVSFLIPTYRNFDNYAKKTIKSIENSHFNFTYEIIVCSKHQITYKNIVWIQEPLENNGAVIPINLAYRAARGKYCSLLTDDSDIDYTFINIIKFLQSKRYSGVNPKFSALSPQHPLINSDDGILRYPVFERDGALQYIGANLMDVQFKHHWCDVFITRYLKEKLKVECPICDLAHIFIRDSSIASSNIMNDDRDLSTYREITCRWG